MKLNNPNDLCNRCENCMILVYKDHIGRACRFTGLIYYYRKDTLEPIQQVDEVLECNMYKLV